MSIERALDDANDDGFRIHQLFQRYAIGDKDVRRNWYFDVVLIHPLMFHYFRGSGTDMEDAIIEAHDEGMAALKKFQRMNKSEKHRFLHPPKGDLEPRKAKGKVRKRVRL